MTRHTPKHAGAPPAETPAPGSLEAGETLASAGATAPRVTLDSMNNRVAAEYYTTGVEAFMATHGGKAHPELASLTLCVLILHNGWTLVGKSAPASAANFDPMKGRIFAREDAIRQLWPLEGYLMRERLFEDEIIAADDKLRNLKARLDKTVAEDAALQDRVAPLAPAPKAAPKAAPKPAPEPRNRARRR